MRLVCTETISVVDAKTGTVAHTQARTASGCFPARRGDQIVTPAMGQTPAIDQSIAIEAAFRQAGIPSGQEPSSVDAKPSSFTDSLALSYWWPPTDRPKTVWIVTMTGFMSRPLDPAAPATLHHRNPAVVSFSRSSAGIRANFSPPSSRTLTPVRDVVHPIRLLGLS